MEKQEMVSLNPTDIAKIDFINNPGIRYGENIAYVINIIKRRNDSGYTLGTDMTSALATLQGEGMVYGKWKQAKSEWSMSYNMSESRTKGEKSMQLAEYTLGNGEINTIERNDKKSLKKRMQLDYAYCMWNCALRVAMTSDACIRINNMEWIAGNPDLKPSHNMDHWLQLSYNTPRLQTFVSGYYKQCKNTNMAIYERTEDDKFVYTQINQKEIDMLNLAAYAGYWLFPEKLQIAANGGMNRCFNFGNDYTHCHTSWFYIGSITAYLGNFTLRGYIDNGNSFLERGTKNCQGAYSVLQASYNRKAWCFSLSWANPLQSDYKSLESELQNRDLYKHSTCFSRNLGNMVSINISWNLSRGKTRRSDERITTLLDTDNGIMK